MFNFGNLTKMSWNAIGLDGEPRPEDLKRSSIKFADDLLSRFAGAGSILKKTLTLLEIFKYQINKFNRLGSCDHELAIFCFKAAQHLIASFRGRSEPKFFPLIEEILRTLEALRPSVLKVQECFVKGCRTQPDLENRFSKLKTGISTSLFPTYFPRSYDIISPSDLNHYLRSSPSLALIVDFRSKKEYSYSHINFLNVVNIDPSIILGLFEEKASPTDRDLEVSLDNALNQQELELFRDRQRFEVVVIYNLKFGLFSDNKYESLVPLLTNTDESFLPDNPFKRLIELLMYRNQFLSSRLKNYPLFLNGGLKRWYESYGEAALTRGPYKSLNESLSVGQVNILSEERESKYLRNFHDYLLSGSDNPSRTTFSIENDGGKKIFNINGSGSNSLDKHSSALEPKKSVELAPIIEYTDSGSSLESLDVCTGLVNLGNSCYMNCILQCLIATPHLSVFLVPSLSSLHGRNVVSYKEHINLENSLGLRGVITVTFVELLTEMLRSKGKSLSPIKFKRVVGSFSPGKQFATMDQQDCIEFLNFMLDSLHEDLNQRLVKSPEERRAITELSVEQETAREYLPVRLASTIEWERYLKLNFSIIVDFFQGQYVSQLRCLECQMTSSTYNSFSTLSLPIPEKVGKLTGSILLFDCLDLFVETELLDDDNKWHCPRCKRFTKLTKKLVISRLPKILIIHFKRFKIQNGHFKKLENFINYPVNDILDLTKYWPPVGSYINPSSTGSMSKTKEIELLSNLPDRLQTPPFRYKLYGVANHFGNLTTGHYTSYVRKSINSKDWNYFDDSKVLYGCLESKVLNQNAYCLFYARC